MVTDDRISDKELADRVCALDSMFDYWYREWLSEYYGAPHFVHDWRVAGALMERCDEWLLTEPCNGVWFVSRNEESAIANDSLPRAIIEACVKALEESDE